MLFEFCIPHFLNMFWKNCSAPMEWNTAKFISTFKKMTIEMTLNTIDVLVKCGVSSLWENT